MRRSINNGCIVIQAKKREKTRNAVTAIITEGKKSRDPQRTYYILHM